MMNTKKLSCLAVFLGAFVFALGPQNAYADGISENVTVDTSGLAASPQSEIVFILNDGSGTGDANNTATLSNFAFGTGGSAGAVDPSNTSGGASGDLTSGASLTDSSFTNSFAAFFTAGSQISFLLNLTTNVDAGPTPDQFSFLILDPNGNPIPTSDPTGFDNLMVINLDSSNPAIESYSTLMTVSAAVATPEPSSLLLLSSGLAGLMGMACRRKRAA